MAYGQQPQMVYSAPPAAAPPMYAQQPQMVYSPPPAAKVMVSPTAAEFRNKRIVCLRSIASKKTLRTMDQKGHCEGLGEEGEFAQWHVHVHSTYNPAEPVIKLQNVKFPSQWLRIDEHGHTNSGGSGGEWCEFALECHPDGTVSLRSVPHHKKHKFLHVGVLENGHIKPADQTGTGPHGRFWPKFVK